MERVTDLLERESELQELQSRVDSVSAEDGRLLVVSGGAGTGKTRLLRALRERAQESHLRVFHARGHDREATSPYGVVHQLFDPVLATVPVRDWDHLFPGAAAHARPIFEDPTTITAAVNPDAALHGLWWFVLALAEKHPICVVVDDLQWCDVESLQCIAFLAHRVDSGRVLLGVAVRTGDVPQHEGLVHEILGQPHADLIHPRPLGETSTQTLIAQTLGSSTAARISGACYAATRGNPLWLHELVRALRVADRDDVGADDVHRIGARTVSRLVVRRLDALSTEAVMLARAAAVLGEGVPLAYSAELAGLSLDAADAAARRLQDAEILEPGDLIRYVHPVVADAVYQSMTPSQRADAHVRAAVILRRHGEPVHRLAAQVAPVPPGVYDDAVAVLRQAAHSALTSGARGSAVTYLRRLLEEPLSDDLRTGMLVQLGSIETLVDGPAAVHHLREAAALLADPVDRAEHALILGPALSFTQRNPEAVEVYQRAMADLDEDADRNLKQRLLAGLLAAAVDDSTLYPAADSYAEELRHLPPEDLDPPLASIMAWHEARTGSARERCTALAERGLSLEAGKDTAAIFAYAGLVLAVADRQQETSALCTRRLEYARATGSVFDFAIASWLRGISAYLSGDVQAAEADQRQAIEAGEEHGLSAGLIYGYSRLAEALIERGQLDEAERTLAQVACPEPLPPLAHFDWWLYTRARLSLAQGHHGEALRDATEVGRRFQSLGGVNPAFLPWRSEAALAHLGLGNEKQAVHLADEEVELAQAWGAPRTIGRSLRVAGVVRQQNGQPRLRQSQDVLRNSAASLEYAHTLVELGIIEHRCGERRAARETLWDGLDEAQRCHADALVGRAKQALVAAGSRPRNFARTGVTGLTPTERRVSSLAATGRSNREIAETLFVTPKTIEMHLSNVYRKLGVHSRSQLSGALENTPEPGTMSHRKA